MFAIFLKIKKKNEIPKLTFLMTVLFKIQFIS